MVASVIAVFKQNKEMQSLLHDIHLDGKEFEIKQLEAQVRKDDVSAKLQSEVQLRALRKQRDELVLKKEISQLEQEINGNGNNQTANSKPSPEQQRASDRSACESRIENLKQEKNKALVIEEPQERILKVNAIDDALQREMERWAKLALV